MKIQNANQDSQTPDDLWDVISEYAKHDPLTHSTFQAANQLGMTREQTAIMLAYVALQKAECLMDDKINQATLSPTIAASVVMK